MPQLHLVTRPARGSHRAGAARCALIEAGRGHSVVVRVAEEAPPLRDAAGTWSFDNLALLAPGFDGGGSGAGGLSASDVVEFIDGGGNVLLAADDTAAAGARRLAAEVGVSLHKAGSAVIDHHNFDALDADAGAGGAGNHTVVRTDGFVAPRAILPLSAPPVVFCGAAMSIASGADSAGPILVGSPTAYSATPGRRLKKRPKRMGAELVLAAYVQARNNARVVVLGSLFALSDIAFSAAARGSACPANDNCGETSNEAFAASVSQWAFQERGVLRLRDATHTRGDGSPPERLARSKGTSTSVHADIDAPEIAPNSLYYRIRDNISVAVAIDHLDGADSGASSWRPFEADDVQVELILMEPIVRVAMQHVGGGRYAAEFVAPGRPGVYKLRVHYRRPGYTLLHWSTQVTLRPFNHDEFDRFLPGAAPFYAAVWVTLVGCLVFGVAFVTASISKTKHD